MKNIISILFVGMTLFFTSCTKEDADNPIKAETKLNVAYGTDAMQRMDIYLPANRDTGNTKVIVMIHGGGWTGGDKADFNAYVDTIKRRLPGYAIFNINYRLANATTFTNGFPTQENDVKLAFDFINTNKSNYLISSKWVALGASAGGHLAMLQSYKQSTPNIKAVVNFFGPSDMVAMYNFPASPLAPPASIALLLQGTPSTNAPLYQSSSPLNFITNNSPATITFQGLLDPLVRADQQDALHARLNVVLVKNSLVTYSSEYHGWVGTNLVDSFDKMQAFLTANVL